MSRPKNNECNYEIADLTAPFDISDADVVIIGKLYSTLYRSNQETGFLKHLKLAVNTLKPDAIVIFIDVNHKDFGRDSFHYNVSQYLPKFEQYYFIPSNYVRDDWTPIHSNYVVFPIPVSLSISALQQTGKTVIFEYRK